MSNNNMKASSSVMDQLAEYRRRQAQRYEDDDEDEDESLQKSYHQQEIAKDEAPVMQKLPDPPVSYLADPVQPPPLSDYELAKQLQDEENNMIAERTGNDSINHHDNAANQPFTDEGIRPPDTYRQERLIPDPAEEEMAQREFIRQQQLLYAQYSAGGNRPDNQPGANEMGPQLQEAGNPLLRNRNREI